MSETLVIYGTPLLTLDPHAKAGGGLVEVVKYSDVKALRDERDRYFIALHVIVYEDEINLVEAQATAKSALTPAAGGGMI